MAWTTGTDGPAGPAGGGTARAPAISGPGAAPDWLAQRLLHTDPPSTALSATQVIWQFFAAHPRPRSA